MIISQVSLSGFKCFKSPETIQLCSNTSTGLNVLLGKNGAGKSTLFDAVDWVLFHQHSAEVRAMSLKKTVKVEVQLRSNNGKVLIVSRTSVRGKCTLTGILSTNRENRDYSGSEEPSPSLDLNAQEVTRALLDIGVNVKTDSQKLILRQNSNSIAMSEPLQLLQFVEDIAGTTELIRLISDCSVSIRSLLDEVGERVQELSVCSTKLCGILPQVAINVSTLEERLTHEKELYEYFIALKISLETEECALDISQEALDRAQYELSSHMNAINTSTKGAEGKRKLEEDATLTLTHASIIKEKNELTLKMRTLAFELTKKAKLQEEVKKKIKRCKECTVTIVAKNASLVTKKSALVEEIVSLRLSIATLQVAVDAIEIPGENKVATLIHSLHALKEPRLITALQMSIQQREDVVHESVLRSNRIKGVNEELQRLVDAIEKQIRDEEIVARTAASQLSILKNNVYDQEMTRDKMNHEKDKLVAQTQEADYQRVSLALLSRCDAFIASQGQLSIVGMLYDVIRPKSPAALVPLVSVLGNSLLHTLVVSTRDDATACGRAQTISGSHDIRVIEITSEYRFDQQRRPRDSNIPRFSPLSHHVKILHQEAAGLIACKLQRWMFFQGSYVEAMRHRCDSDMVTADGYKIYHDGEIRTHSISHCHWPIRSVTPSDPEYARKDLPVLLKKLYDLECSIKELDKDKLLLEKAVGESRVRLDLLQNRKSDLVGQMTVDREIVVDMRQLAADKMRREALILENREQIASIEKDLQDLTGSRDYCTLIEELSHQESIQIKLKSEKNKLSEAERGLQKVSSLLDRYVQQLEDARNEVLMNEAYLERVESSLELDRQTEVTESRMLAELTSEFLQSTARINAIKDEKRRVQTETARLEKQLRVEESKYEMNIQEKADLQQKAHKAGQNAELTKLKFRATEDRLTSLQTMLEKPMMSLVGESNDENKGTEYIGEPHHKRRKKAFTSIVHTRKELDTTFQKLKMRSKVLESSGGDQSEDIFAVFRSLYHENDALETGIRLKQQEASAVNSQRIHYEKERYICISKALEQINDSVGTVYGQLVKYGNCFLSFPSDQVSLFSEGVKLRAQHGHSAWSDVTRLSGGQQAGCGLALILAMQELKQLPFYLMDEVDASLDTRTVSRMGQLLRERAQLKSCQYIIVSHRPELHAFATTVTGLYIHNGSPKSFTHSFDDLLMMSSKI